MVLHKEWDFSTQLTDWGFSNHILKGQEILPSLAGGKSSTNPGGFSSEFPYFLSLLSQSPHSFLCHHTQFDPRPGWQLPFEVTASAALCTPWQWAFGDNCWPSLLQQSLHFTWQWPCVLPGSLGGRPIVLGPGLPPSVLPASLNRNRMVVKCWRSPDHHYLL